MFENSGNGAAAAVDYSDVVAVLRQFGNGAGTFAQSRCIFEGGSSDFYDDGHCSPSSSFHPYIRFMFWTACPAAPLSRLSRQEINTSRRPSSAKQNPRSQ